MSTQQDLSGFEQLFLALSDRTRLRLLALMAGGAASVGYLADQLNESQPKTSRHLAYLRNAGLVSTMREGKWVYYHLESQSDPGIQNVLLTALGAISGAVGKFDPNQAVLSAKMEAYISPDPYTSDWKPNDLDIHLL